MSARKINLAVAIFVFVALAGNAATECTGWALAGDVFGWLLIVGILFAVVDNYIKERSAQ